MTPSSVLLAHPGTQYAPHLARELDARGRLRRFWTGFAIAEGSWGGRLLKGWPDKIQRRISNRVVEVSGSHLRTLPLLEWTARKAARRVGDERAFFDRNRQFQEAIPDREISESSGVIGFDTSSWVLARRAKNRHRRFILDQSIGHPLAKERIFKQLRQRFHEWGFSAPKKNSEMQEAEREEHELADAIVAPSQFVKQTLVAEGVDAGKVHVIPFGTDLNLFHPPQSRQGGLNGRPVVFLFLGGLTARKGLPLLLAAWRLVEQPGMELWLAGTGALPEGEVSKLSPSVKILGAQSRQAVAGLMRQADVFVFPSFFEGLAQVQIEALATGLPVIGTHESGAGQVVKNGVTGEIVPAGDEQALAVVMDTMSSDHDLRGRMQAAALASREQLSWKIYGDRWEALLTTLGC